MLQDHFKEITLIDVESFEEFISYVKKNKPKVVIFEALNFSYKALRQVKEMFGFDVYVHVHSSFPFLAYDIQAVKMIKDFNRCGIKVIFNSREGLSAFPNNIYLRNIYKATPKDPKTFEGDTINIGCHGSLRHMKNVPIQAVAAIKYADKKGLKINFHVNGTRDDGEAKPILITLNNIFNQTPHSLIKDKWMDHHNFLNHCRELDLGMQVSINETFNLVTADYVTCGLPVVVSREISWVNKDSFAHTTDPSDIASKIDYVLNNRALTLDNQKLLEDHNCAAIDDWMAFIKEQYV